MLRLTGDESARPALQQIAWGLVSPEPTWTAFNLRLRIYWRAPRGRTGGDVRGAISRTGRVDAID